MRMLTVEGRYASVVMDSVGYLEGGDPTSYWPGRTVDFVPLADGTPVTRDYEQVYLTNPWLFATINMLANGVARMPLKVYRYTDDEGNRERIRPQSNTAGDAAIRRAESLARALHRPGHGVSAQSLWRSTMVNRKVWGPAVWVIERDAIGDYTGFQRIPFRHLQRDRVAGVVRYWDVRKPNVKHLADDIIHFGFSADCSDWDAPSPIGALHATLALYDAVERHLVAFFKNSARPSGHYEVQPGTGKKARTAIATAIRTLYASPENAGKVLITSAKWNSYGTTPDHSRVVELAKQAREEIVAVYNMPPPLVGILDRAIMSNVRELRSHYARDVVGPDCVLFEGDFDAQLIAQDPLLASAYVEFELAAVMRPDLEARAATYSDRLNVESLNEVRGTEGLPKIDHPDADLPRMPLNEKPIGAEPAPAPEPPLMQQPPEREQTT